MFHPFALPASTPMPPPISSCPLPALLLSPLLTPPISIPCLLPLPHPRHLEKTLNRVFFPQLELRWTPGILFSSSSTWSPAIAPGWLPHFLPGPSDLHTAAREAYKNPQVCYFTLSRRPGAPGRKLCKARCGQPCLPCPPGRLTHGIPASPPLPLPGAGASHPKPSHRLFPRQAHPFLLASCRLCLNLQIPA